VDLLLPTVQSDQWSHTSIHCWRLDEQQQLRVQESLRCSSIAVDIQLPTRQSALSNLLRYSAVESTDESKLTSRLFLMLRAHACKLDRIWSLFQNFISSVYNSNLRTRSKWRSHLRLLSLLTYSHA